MWEGDLEKICRQSTLGSVMIGGQGGLFHWWNIVSIDSIRGRQTGPLKYPVGVGECRGSGVILGDDFCTAPRWVSRQASRCNGRNLPSIACSSTIMAPIPSKQSRSAWRSTSILPDMMPPATNTGSDSVSMILTLE